MAEHHRPPILTWGSSGESHLMQGTHTGGKNIEIHIGG